MGTTKPSLVLTYHFRWRLDFALIGPAIAEGVGVNYDDLEEQIWLDHR
jgi:hypothetical protein